MKKPTPPEDIHIEEAYGLIQHSIKRVKKKLNDFILNNFTTLFPSEASGLSKEVIYSHPKLLTKAAEELRLSTEMKKDPKELLIECI